MQSSQKDKKIASRRGKGKEEAVISRVKCSRWLEEVEGRGGDAGFCNRKVLEISF